MTHSLLRVEGSKIQSRGHDSGFKTRFCIDMNSSTKHLNRHLVTYCHKNIRLDVMRYLKKTILHKQSKTAPYIMILSFTPFAVFKDMYFPSEYMHIMMML